MQTTKTLFFFCFTVLITYLFGMIYALTQVEERDTKTHIQQGFGLGLLLEVEP